jgi:hypothetical protein
MSPKSATELVPLVRQLLSECPQYANHEGWELVHVLYSLGYVDDLLDEGELDAALQVAQTDWTGGEAA